MKLSAVLGETALLFAMISYVVTIPSRQQQQIQKAREILLHTDHKYDESRIAALKVLDKGCGDNPGLVAPHAYLANLKIVGCSRWSFRLQNPDQWSFRAWQPTDLSYSMLAGANLSNANLIGANLQGSELQNANLQKVNLKGVNLRGANLRGANLTGADLSRANLMGADFYKVNLEDASLRFTNLQGDTRFVSAQL